MTRITGEASRVVPAMLAVLTLAGCDEVCEWRTGHAPNTGTAQLERDGTRPIVRTWAGAAQSLRDDDGQVHTLITVRYEEEASDLIVTIHVYAVALAESSVVTLDGSNSEVRFAALDDRGFEYELWRGSARGTARVVSLAIACQGQVCATDVVAELDATARGGLGAIHAVAAFEQREDLFEVCSQCPGFEGCND